MFVAAQRAGPLRFAAEGRAACSSSAAGFANHSANHSMASHSRSFASDRCSSSPRAALIHSRLAYLADRCLPSDRPSAFPACGTLEFGVPVQRATRRDDSMSQAVEDRL